MFISQSQIKKKKKGQKYCDKILKEYWKIGYDFPKTNSHKKRKKFYKKISKKEPPSPLRN